jgi:transcriptional regulator GlxA family with amidase domain
MRSLIVSVIVLGMTASTVSAHAAGAAADTPIRVAFIISEKFNVIDFAGSWEVFLDTVVPDTSSGNAGRSPFKLYTVSARQEPVHSEGGALVTPEYTFETAPAPDVVIIGAQSDRSPELIAWLRSRYVQSATLVSVCVGASQLAATGLLDGKQATTHHDYFVQLRKLHPKVEWIEGRRFVHSGTHLYTAGGLTSGIDLALHLVAERFGDSVAEATAETMEYRSTEWRASGTSGQ